MKAPPEIQRNTASKPPANLGFPVGEGDEIGPGWALNSINATAFSKSPLVTSARADNGDEIQTVAYYDPQANLVIARKNLTRGTEWERHITQYSGQVLDGHNSISLAVDGDGYLHVSWGMHGQPMQYARSLAPWSMFLGPIEPLTGRQENRVTYPEFHQQSNGNLFMLYRSGLSGDGNLVVNHYNTSTRRWTQVQSNLIDGLSQRKSPYWQAAVDSQDRLHVSWNWRSTPDVYTNHDFMYARSTDATGTRWEKSTGEPYAMPITAEQAELIVPIPQGSELMNQTAMAVDEANNPYIVSYWRPEPDEPIQYMIMYLSEGEWKVHNTGLRQTDFTHYTPGSKLAIMGRPKILVTGSGSDAIIHLIVRDKDFFGSAATLLSSRVGSERWSSLALTDDSLRYWEPVFDIARWQRSGQLDILVARTGGIRSTVGNYPPENFYVLRVPQDYLALVADEGPGAGDDGDGDSPVDDPEIDEDVTVPTVPPADESTDGCNGVEGENETCADPDVLPSEPAEELPDAGKPDVPKGPSGRGDEGEDEIASGE
nr:BNR repeat-containing protein [Flaviflexus huanghaiensis]